MIRLVPLQFLLVVPVSTCVSSDCYSPYTLHVHTHFVLDMNCWSVGTNVTCCSILVAFYKSECRFCPVPNCEGHGKQGLLSSFIPQKSHTKSCKWNTRYPKAKVSSVRCDIWTEITNSFCSPRTYAKTRIKIIKIETNSKDILPTSYCKSTFFILYYFLLYMIYIHSCLCLIRKPFR